MLLYQSTGRRGEARVEEAELDLMSVRGAGRRLAGFLNDQRTCPHLTDRAVTRARRRPMVQTTSPRYPRDVEAPHESRRVRAETSHVPTRQTIRITTSTL